MMHPSLCLRSFVIAVFVAVSAVCAAGAAGWMEKGIYLIGPRYEGVLPPCEAALNTIASRFAQKEGRFWNSDLQILGFDKIRETRLPTLGATDDPAPLLYRHRDGQRWASAHGALLDRRGCRHDRDDLGG